MGQSQLRTLFFTILLTIVFAACGGSGGNGGDGDDDDDSGGGVGQTYLRSFSFSLPLFASNSGWNQTASSASVLASSAQQILVTYRVLRGDTSDLSAGTGVPNWHFPDVSYDDYSVAIFAMGSGTESVLMRDYEGNAGGNNPKVPIGNDNTVTVPAPEGTIRPAGPQSTDADGHTVLYNTTTNIEYDFWQPTTARDGSDNSLGGGQAGTSILEAGSIDYFDVTGSGVNPDGYSSARASGPPLLAGMILPEDVESGTIAHALGFSIPGPRNTATDPSSPSSSDYFYPVSTTETDFYSTNANALASGQRIRLKQTIVDDSGSTIDEGSLAPITQMFLAALRTYGAIVVDNASGFSFYAEDIHTAPLDMTDDEVNTLIGQATGTALSSSKTKWQLAMEKLNEELEGIPFAYGTSTTTITTANFEVVTAASEP